MAPNSSWRKEVIAQSEEEVRGDAASSASKAVLSPLQLLGSSDATSPHQTIDHDAYAASPQDDWDQSPQHASQGGDGESILTESEQIEPNERNDWDQRRQGLEELDWDQRERLSKESTSLREVDSCEMIATDW